MIAVSDDRAAAPLPIAHVDGHGVGECRPGGCRRARRRGLPVPPDARAASVAGSARGSAVASRRPARIPPVISEPSTRPPGASELLVKTRPSSVASSRSGAISSITSGGGPRATRGRLAHRGHPRVEARPGRSSGCPIVVAEPVATPVDACAADPIAEASSAGPSALTSRSMSSSACWSSKRLLGVVARSIVVAGRQVDPQPACRARSGRRTSCRTPSPAGSARRRWPARCSMSSFRQSRCRSRTPSRTRSRVRSELTLPTRTPFIFTSDPLRSAPPGVGDHGTRRAARSRTCRCSATSPRPTPTSKRHQDDDASAREPLPAHSSGRTGRGPSR